MSYLQTQTLSHAQKVRRLYKNGLRLMQSMYGTDRVEMRYWSVLLRAKFDEHKNEIDFRKAKELLMAGEQKLWENQHPQPYLYAHSPGGICYGREVKLPDWILDTWTPQEKAQYPEYFARREIRKREYIERWENKYGKTSNDAH
ncbi:Hypothetical predicted protein [Octopus vulgaris]|uniref:NADH dehydrogenase [ubiquinone] 1 beta subcomplex subunit 9 n=1 Tax=Octopus vulgaris TaxID=6645 RepID=A0AA36F1F1_OCTVU|nr:Hypothetical predicted protein [Octopus vulgaris]